jgi:hypothetical protein
MTSCLIVVGLMTVPVASGAGPLERGRPGSVPVGAQQEPGPALPASGAWFGASANTAHNGETNDQDATEIFEGLIDRKLAVKRVYYPWDKEFPGDVEYWMRDRGTTPLLSWQTSLLGEPIVTWRDVAAGQYDADIDERAAGIIAFGAPMFFVFHHEPEGEGDPAEFVAAYRHVHDRFVADGVTNVTYGWILMSSTFRQGEADQWYPGDDYVDIVGVDGYNWYGCPGRTDPWKSFTDVFSDFYDFGLSKGKPMMIGEWASTEDPDVPGRKADWITDAAATLKTWPQIKVISWFDMGIEFGSQCDWWVDSTPSSLAAYAAMGADPYFNPPPPLVTITSSPPDPDDSSSATFSFEASIPGSTFTCFVDGEAAKPCSSPYTFTGLSSKEHTATISATDPVSGLRGSIRYIWTVDTIDPVVSILSGPSDYTNEPDTTFHIKTSEPHSGGFKCRLDDSGLSECDRWVDYTGLADGLHTFVANAYDDAGNVSAPVSASWTVDTTAPKAMVTSGPEDLTNVKTATFTFISNEPDAEFRCAKDDGGFSSCTSPKTYNWMSDGPHTFSVMAQDPAQNLSTEASWTWAVDATFPIVTITFGPPDPSFSDQATFRFTAGEEGVTFTCQLDLELPAPCSSPKTYSRVPLGVHVFSVYGTDPVGNSGLPAWYTWARIGAGLGGVRRTPSRWSVVGVTRARADVI